MRERLARLIKCRSGATAVEYSIIAGIIGIALITVLGGSAVEIQGIFEDVEEGLQKRS